MTMRIKSFRRYTKHLLIILLIDILPFNAESQQSDIVNYSDNPGIGNAYIYNITKDSLGYLWIGTGEGLIRYNGKSFKTFTTEDSLSDNFISACINDGKCMWIGHMNGSVSLYNGSGFEKVRLNIEEQGPVTGFGKDTNGSVWMSNYNGKLLKLDQREGVKEIKSFKADESILTFLFISADSILIGTPSGLYLCKVTAEELYIISKIPGTAISGVVQIIEMQRGNGYYAATANDGILILDNGINVKGRINGINDVQSICEDKFNTLWVATFGSGVLTIENGQIKTTDLKDKAGENIKVVFATNDGYIWIGGYGSGLTRIGNRIFSHLKLQYDIYGQNVTAICHEGKNAWLGTEKCLIKTDLKGKIIFSNSTIKSKITSICPDGKGNVWIGTESEGVFILNDSNELEKYEISNGSLEKSITSIAGTDDFIWIGTKKGICRVGLRDLQKKWYTINSGLPHNSINNLFKDNSGRVWISSRSNILAYIVNEEVTRVAFNSENSAISFSDFESDEESFLWAGSSGNGLYRINNDSVLNISAQNGLYSDFCHGLICDDKSHIWVIHKDGLSRVTTKNYFVRVFDKFDITGEKTTFNMGAASIDEDGIIWIGTDNGIILINQSKEFYDMPPVPEILSVRINNKEYEPGIGRIILKPGKYTIEIEYSAVSQKEPELVTYSVFLDGYDNQPELTRLNRIAYNEVSEGSYIFTLNAFNGDGISSYTPRAIEIAIRTTPFKQWWFYLLLLLFLTIMVIAYIRRREYKYKAERIELEKKVSERTREIQEQKNEIELQRDQIRAKNAEITSSIRYALEIQNALLPSAARIDRYFPENFILMRPKDIVSGDFYWLARKNERIVFTVADCTGHGVPGAFMSMLSISILNEIVNIEGITEPDKIVNRLHALIYKSLNRSRADGLDMAICTYDWTNRKIQFTGAMNHLVYFRNGNFNIIKADQCSVNMVTDEDFTFSMHELSIKKGDVIYLYSDGYMDQFGGAKDKKYSMRRFHETLNEIHKMPMQEQKAFLELKLSDWMKNCDQTDDITIMGIRF